jgi:glycosyltransferase involved in cell wall biosynthesis
MISVIIPTCNAAASLPATFRSLFEAAIEGLVSEVIVSDCGSADATAKIADATGATVIQASPGQQLLAGAKAARKTWLLFLKPGSAMESGWEEEARDFIAAGGHSAGAFRFRLAAKGLAPRLREAVTTIGARTVRLPKNCDGLLIPARLFEAAWAASTPQGEEAILMRRLGRNRVCFLKAAVIACPARA